VSGSAAWCRRLARQTGVNPRFSEPIGPAPEGISDLPEDLPGIEGLLEREGAFGVDRETIAAAIIALRAADAVIAGPFSPDDGNSPGLLQHLADLAGGAYRALRPPRELVVHPAFAQVARRFQFIQMTHQEARRSEPAPSIWVSWGSGSAACRKTTASSRSRPSPAAACCGQTRLGGRSSRSTVDT
jgi:hypothetical protein